MIEIKICGFKRKKDIIDAISLGIKWIGLNFYEKSLRFISEKEAKILIEDLPDDIKKIGVFVNPEEKKILEIVKRLRLNGIQLHGNEPPTLLKKFKKLFSEKILIKAIQVKNKEDVLKKIERYKKVADFFLLDTYQVNSYGGTGKKINYKEIEDLNLPWNRIFIAGGISPENIRDIIERIRPFGIDVASGVEIAPGIKDIEKIKKLIVEVENVTK
jgi:phosphoribosylanthranilate isomerase